MSPPHRRPLSSGKELEIADKKNTQITLSGGFMINVKESLTEVGERLNQAARDNQSLVAFTSAAFISSVSDQVLVNPAHETQVMEVPTGLPGQSS
jgi:hypothetical protein